MKLVKKGNEGDIYLWKSFAVKRYHSGISNDKKERELKFLKEYTKTGAVPMLLSDSEFLEKYNAIVMEYLKDYMTLFDFKKLKKNFSKEEQNDLLKELIKARLLIGFDKGYSDLHSKNVMVKLKNGKAMVKMIDPGKQEDYHGADVWLDWILDVIHELNWKRLPLYKILKTKNVKKIKKQIF